jgi:WD40 repeat protein
VAITTSRDGTARVWDLATGHTTITLTGHTRQLTGVATTTLDGRPVAITTSDDDTARVWDLRTGYTIAVLTGHTGGVSGVATTTFDGHPVAITTGGDQTVRVWDVATAGCQATWPFPDAVDCITIATDGNVVLGMGHEVIALDLAPFLRELP